MLSFQNIISSLFLISLCICVPIPNNFLSTRQSYTPRETPFTNTEYLQALKFGFDTDLFKTSPPLKNFANTNNRVFTDLLSKGVGHLRLRSRADLFGFETQVYNPDSMAVYLDSLEKVVDGMISVGLFPIISWINGPVEESSALSTVDEDNYVQWWSLVAQRLANTTYELAFNLFTEIDQGPLREPSTYNRWTSRAVNAIRLAGGRNVNRIIILGAPGKDADSLPIIDSNIYENYQYFIAEWHLYASGPDHSGGRKNWVGNGSESDRENVDSLMKDAETFTSNSKVGTWIGAWMPYDNINADLNQEEVENFACYFAKAAKSKGIPWAMNKMENFYDTKRNVWIQTMDIGRNDKVQTLFMPNVLQKALCAF